MKKFLLLLLFTACYPDEKDVLPVPSCETTYSYCEWDAVRHDQFIALFYLRDCSYDYGVCLGKDDNRKDCKEWCENIVWMPSICTDVCYGYRSKP